MFIERVQVEEGFLDGLDVLFAQGLNVIIGARGTGKTSLIELIRFCLDVGGSNEISRRSKDHALSVLGSGQVTVTLNNQGERIYVSRTAGEVIPRATGIFNKPMMFSQTEIETIGLEPSGRLRLIDAFIGGIQGETAQEDKLAAEIRSLTTEIDRSRRELEEFERQLKSKPILQQELKANDLAKAALSQSSQRLNDHTKTLAGITSIISQNAINSSNANRGKEVIAKWYHEIKGVTESPSANEANSDSSLALYKPRIEWAVGTIATVLNEVEKIYHEISLVEKKCTDEKIIAENSSRQIRAEIEGLQVGAGHVMRRDQELAEKMAKVDAVFDIHANKSEVLKRLVHRRSEFLELLDQSRKNRFALRVAAITRLNRELSPNIRIQIRKNGQYPIFAAVLGEALRGSGIKYGEIVPAIAENISPRALLDAIESFDVAIIAETAKISSERASRILAHLRNCDLGTLSTVNIEDEVSFQLLDGRDYKELRDLSTGQRCTVILPIVLAHHDRILVVDQPEDHIDNAFITNTLIKSVLARTRNSQIIFSTHNPNIPVLGNADCILHMGSDGRRGFKICLGNLFDPVVVSAISTVMEGGADAFSRRAQFYSYSSLI